ncbi:type II toxin-antitoxin system death-on-curing family toxin [Ottowia pentelensis]|uniref:Type II toxin-antitoxin system death-on-curing family toxin n=1 Tax=Ottowia pentelensis TaxID=511108 RepID=A0ABV6PQM7_9BURK|nr:type II toxin-antitoxin system death-on-curing family toxin [Pseudomonadota bacterium]MBS0414123.1 type II toxin-antitoxin system death-on-curing family toxin [Pseudomonadota bacterium]
MSWRWISKPALLLLHAESLAEHGGSPGLRDEGLLDSALARPQNLLAYGEPDAAALAAAYGSGVARNHPFIDGNKRAALLSIGLFLHLNGWRLTASQADTTRTMLALAAGELPEDALADWLRRHAAPRA